MKDDIIALYLSKDSERNQPGRWIYLPRTAHQGNQGARFVAVKFRCPDPTMNHHPYPDCALEVELSIESDAPKRVDRLAVIFYDRYGTKLVNVDNVALGESIWLDQGLNNFIVNIDQFHLNPDTYVMGLWLANNNHVIEYIRDALEVEVVEPPSEAFGRRPPNDGKVTCTFSIIKRAATTTGDTPMEPIFG